MHHLGAPMTDFALARRNMIDGQLRPNRVTNAALLAAVADLPRDAASMSTAGPPDILMPDSWATPLPGPPYSAPHGAGSRCGDRHPAAANDRHLAGPPVRTRPDQATV